MEDLELPADLGLEAAGAGPGSAAEGGPFVAPTPGVPAAQKWLERRTQLAAEFAAAGQFDGAMSLLFRCGWLGVCDWVGRGSCWDWRAAGLTAAGQSAWRHTPKAQTLCP